MRQWRHEDVDSIDKSDKSRQVNRKAEFNGAARLSIST